MNTQDLIRLGVPAGEPIKQAHVFIREFIAAGNDGSRLEEEIFRIVVNPSAFFADELRAPLARAIYRPAFTPRAELAPWRQWGEGLEADAVNQMANACALPVAVAGALMPDAHVGYGLPIGGVLATENAVIPYAVGVDIACRMKLTVYDRKANTLPASATVSRTSSKAKPASASVRSSRPAPRPRRDGRGLECFAGDQAAARQGLVATRDQRQRQSLRRIRRVHRDHRRTAVCLTGEYLALLSHSGSRGTGAQVCDTTASARWPATDICRRNSSTSPGSARRGGRPGILGRHEPDGPLCRRKPRTHPPAHREKARRPCHPRHRKPPQLRVEGTPSSSTARSAS